MSAFDDQFSNDAFMGAFAAPVVYRRGAVEVEVSAMDSLIGTEARLEMGASLAVDLREFVILCEDIKILTTPERGDFIETSRNEVWEVSRIGQLPEWEYDADRNYYRIRTALSEEGTNGSE